MDIQDKTYCPTQEDLENYIRTPVFGQLCAALKETYRCTGKAEYSCCSMERGWNLSFRKGGKSLCRIYPREGWFTVLLVVGQKGWRPFCPNAPRSWGSSTDGPESLTASVGL